MRETCSPRAGGRVMEFRRIRTLSGPNVWSRKPVLEAWVDLGALKDTGSDMVPGFTARLMEWLPSLIEHRCSVGERGGFLQRLERGTYPAHILEHVSLELQSLAGTPVGFGKARETHEEGVYRVVIRFKEEALARAALHEGRDLLLAAYEGRDFDVAAAVARLKDVADDVRLGPSTTAIVGAAEARGIPTRRLNAGSLVQLGHGAKQRRIWTAETDATSAVAETIAQDKDLTKQLLRAAGVPVPAGQLVTSADEAWEVAQEIGLPVVVKPRDGNHGRGVCINLFTREQVASAFDVAKPEGSGVIVETCAAGNEHRLLVVGGRLVAAARGEAAVVVGDGVKTIAVLIEEQLNSDPRRGDSHDSPLAKIEFDEPTMLLLTAQHCTRESVPPAGASILIQRNGNLRIDVTDEVHPLTAANVELAARVVGLDVTGIDVVATDISKPLEEQGGVVVEVNASPGLHAHLMPGVGKPRPVGEAIVGTLFKDGDDGRIPLACITGTNGKTTVATLLAHLQSQHGRRVGLATSDGIRIEGRMIERGDCAGPRSARKVLIHPRVDVAVLEAGRGGILREGLGFDKCSLAIVTNIGAADHLGRHDVTTPEEMFTVKRSPVDVVLPTGASVLNAADPLVADMARLSDGEVLFFARDPATPVLAAHREAGKRAVFVDGGVVMLGTGPVAEPLVALEDVPLTLGGRVGFQVENVLAATAGAWAMGIPLDRIREGLRSFAGVASRLTTFPHKGGLIVVDDAHNVSAVEALIGGLDRFPHRRRSIVFSGGRHRRNEDIVRQGELLGAAFDEVVVYEDSNATERVDGELTTLITRGVSAGNRALDVLELRDHRIAVETAILRMKSGALLVVQAEDGDAEASLALVRSLLPSPSAEVSS